MKRIKMGTKIKGTILIVEDEKPLNSMLEKILNKLGFEVIKAFNGAEGVDLFKENNKKISLVILDMKMPVMNGKEAFIEMKKIDDNVKALLSTGYGANEEALEIMKMGAKDILSKPYLMKELSLKISELSN